MEQMPGMSPDANTEPENNYQPEAGEQEQALDREPQGTIELANGTKVEYYDEEDRKEKIKQFI